MRITFTPPASPSLPAPHHALAAAGNVATAGAAIETLFNAMSARVDVERILLRAAAGAGKSFVLKRMVEEALTHPRCRRIAITAFANKQVFPLAEALGKQLGRDRVCLFVAKDRAEDVPDNIREVALVESDYKEVPPGIEVVLATSHKLGGNAKWLEKQLGLATDGEHLFDLLFVDEAWQLPLHRYREVERLAPIAIGVGDVGQLPPIDPGQNPWRGDRGYNPYRAWPTAYERDRQTWVRELPAVWRPCAEQLPLWRAFYGDWESLNCVAGAGDRSIELGALEGASADVWRSVATGVPTLVEVDGLPDPDAADIDPPLLGVVEGWLDDLLTAGFVVHAKTYDGHGDPDGDTVTRSDAPHGDALIAVLATRNQAVDDAHEMVERLVAKHDLPEGVLVASTVDSWQGQTNAITVAIHPLSGAYALDEFNSAFGRLAVTCTRATHGLLLVSRKNLDELLAVAPARPGTPLGEPGTRQLPRQTHGRILQTFARGVYHAAGA